MSHVPVLLEEVLSVYKDRKIHYFIDCTVGAGGHSLALLKAHPEIQTLVAFDQDVQALQLAKETLQAYASKLIFVHANFSEIETSYRQLKLPLPDGILMDIGVSSMQLDQAQRGFSFLKEGPLDMRMNPEQALNAETIVNEWSQKELSHIFKEFGEERHHRAIAAKICKKRQEARITSTGALSQILSDFAKGRGATHPATRVFQALRIVVNDELGHLQRGLEGAVEILNSSGLLSLITFHSLEDRIVKHFFKDKSSKRRYLPEGNDTLIHKKAIVELPHKKPIIASRNEQRKNPRSRSAKLRVAQKKSMEICPSLKPEIAT